LKKIVFILIVLFVISSCNKREYDFTSNQKPYYKVIHNWETSLILKSTNGKTSNLRIKAWALADTGDITRTEFISHDSNAVFYDLDNGFYYSLAMKKTDELYEIEYIKGNKIDIDSTQEYLSDSLRIVYPNDLEIKQIDFFNDNELVFRKSLYWRRYSEEEFHLKDFIKPNHFYKVDFGNPRFKGNHVHHNGAYYESFEFKTNEKNKLIYFEHLKKTNYRYRMSRVERLMGL